MSQAFCTISRSDTLFSINWHIFVVTAQAEVLKWYNDSL